MNRLVALVFKTIAFAMVFVFAWDMVFYLYRALSVNQKMETLMTSVQNTVMENNYLPEGDYKMYEAIVKQMQEDMGGPDASPTDNNSGFIAKYGFNFGTQPRGTVRHFNASKYTIDGSKKTTDIVRTDMSVPAEYGDVMVCQAWVTVYMPFWQMGARANAPAWQRTQYLTTDFVYTYYVPCLKYQAIQNNL